MAKKDKGPTRMPELAETHFSKSDTLVFAMPLDANRSRILSVSEILAHPDYVGIVPANLKHARAFVADLLRYCEAREDRRKPRMSVVFPGTMRVNQEGYIVVPHVQRSGMFLCIEWVRLNFKFLPCSLVAYVDLS